MKELQTYNVGDGTVATVIWLDAEHQPVAPDKATSARITFSDGELAVFAVERSKPRMAARRETRLHTVADSYAPRVEVAVRLAFALGRKAIGHSKDVEKAVKAIRASLADTLPKVLRRVYAEGGSVAAGMLRVAEFNESKHPRDGHGRWTDGDNSDAKEVEVTDELLRIAVKDSEALQHPHKGDIESDVQGVIVGSARALDKSINRGDTTIDAVKQDFKATREYLREKYGETLKLYRVDAPVEKHSKQTLTVYMGDKKLADRFGKSRPYVVKTDEIVGVFATKSGYYEFIVEKPKDGLRDLEGFRTAKRTNRKRVGPLAFTFDSASDEAIAWADRHAAELIDGISETSREAINNAIAEALENGTDPYEEILEAVGDEERAHLIAHHEVMMAVHEGQREAWRQAVNGGLLTGTERPTWIVTGDDKVCSICTELEGKTRDLDGQYETEDGEFDGPPAHPRCRCTEGLS